MSRDQLSLRGSKLMDNRCCYHADALHGPYGCTAHVSFGNTPLLKAPCPCRRKGGVAIVVKPPRRWTENHKARRRAAAVEVSESDLHQSLRCPICREFVEDLFDHYKESHYERS